MADLVYDLVRELQLLVGTDLCAADVDQLRAVLARVPEPRTPLEDAIVRGLVYEWMVRAGLRYRIERHDGSVPYYTLGSVDDAVEIDRQPPRSGVAERTRTLIDEGFARSLGRRDLAQRVGCHVTYLARAFKRTYGVTIGEYLRRARAAKGLELLTTSAVPVETIARRVGFRGKANFYAAIRAATGKTPGQVRRDAESDVQSVLGHADIRTNR